MPFCAIKWCRRNSTTSNYTKDGVTFHRFPKRPEIKEAWIDACRKDNWFPTINSVICSRHFTSDCFEYLKNNRRRLYPRAIPTLDIYCLSSTSASNSGFENHNLINAVSNPPASPKDPLKQEDDSDYMVVIKEECEESEVHQQSSAGNELLTPISHELLTPISHELLAPISHRSHGSGASVNKAQSSNKIDAPLVQEAPSTSRSLSNFPLATVVMDNLQIFANSVAEQLRGLPINRALLLQVEIQTMIDNERQLAMHELG